VSAITTHALPAWDFHAILILYITDFLMFNFVLTDFVYGFQPAKLNRNSEFVSENPEIFKKILHSGDRSRNNLF